MNNKTPGLSSPNATNTTELAKGPVKRRGRQPAVAQWSAGFEIGPDDGEIRSTPRQVTPKYVAPDDADILIEAGLDPREWQVVSQRQSRWEVWDGRTLEAFKLSVRRRTGQQVSLDPAEINAVLRDYSRPRKTKPSTDGRVLLVPVADMQIGKVDGGGTEGTIERIGRMVQEIADEIILTLGKGKKASAIVPAFAGDCIEGIVSQGGKLVTRLDLSLTEQLRVYRRLVAHIIYTLAPLCDKMLVLVVPGNHDQTSRMHATKPSDSWAIEGMSAVAGHAG